MKTQGFLDWIWLGVSSGDMFGILLEESFGCGERVWRRSCKDWNGPPRHIASSNVSNVWMNKVQLKNLYHLRGELVGEAHLHGHHPISWNFKRRAIGGCNFIGGMNQWFHDEIPEDSSNRICSPKFLNIEDPINIHLLRMVNTPKMPWTCSVYPRVSGCDWLDTPTSFI